MKRYDKFIDVKVVYNAFDPSDVKKDQLVWRKSTKLKTYLSDLPKECEWKIGLNGQPIDLVKDGNRRLKAGDSLQLVVVPRGGGGFKDILRMVALIAIAVVALPLAGAIGLSGIAMYAAAAAFIVAGTLLVNAILPPKMPKTDEENSQSYGYDGAKNTAREGVAVPVVYGRYRVAGNYIDVYTQNVGDDQYLYGRTILSDGIIQNVSQPLLNEQPINNYTNVDWGAYSGTDTDPINPFFNRNVTQLNKNIKLGGGWTTHTTTEEVDQIQINLSFPRGLANINDKGKKQNRTATVEVQISPAGANAWSNIETVRTVMNNGSSGSSVTGATDKLYMNVRPTGSGTGLSENYAYNIEIQQDGSGTWETVHSANETSSATNITQEPTLNWGELQTGTAIYQPAPNTKTFWFGVPLGEYLMRVNGDAEMTGWGYQQNAYSTNTYSFTDNRLKTLRKTIESGKIPVGHYDIRIRKTTGDGDNEKSIEEIYLTDIGEITSTGVGVRNVANAYYKIKMTEQLSGVPNITWLVDGVKVNRYDSTGTVTSNSWSDNPAWIVLDMLIGERRGTPGLYSIDFPMFIEWADYCEENGLKFNGVFDETQSLWDACVDVLKVGHAAFTRIGTKLSLAIDRPQEPVMLFGPGNIFKDSFKINYMPMTDRANEFELSYFDRDDNNKQKTIRIVDPDANARGDIPRAVSYSLIGIDNFTQAQKEAWYQLYNNRYLKRTISFDAPVESIGLGIGDVALIQHDMMDWGSSGRIAAGSTTTIIKLDKRVLMENGNDYSLLVIHDKIVRATGDAVNVTGGNVLVVENLDNSNADAKRIYQPSTGIDREIININLIGTTAYVTFNGTDDFSIAPVQLVDTDVIEERDVTLNVGEIDTVVVTSAFTQAPNQYSNYMFGVKEIVKKPYRLKSSSGAGFDRRTLTFIEYNPAIYNEPEHIVPAPPTSMPKTPVHVTELTFVPEPRATDANTSVIGMVSWKAPNNYNYGGADIYVSVNDSEYSFVKTVLNVSEAQLTFNLNDTVKIKVVAFNNAMVRAPIGTAPYVEAEINSGPSFIDPPSNLAITQLSYLAVGIVEARWLKPSSLTDVPVKHRVQVRKSFSAMGWDEYGITSELYLTIGDLSDGEYYIRVRNELNQAYSEWTSGTFTVTKVPGQTIDPGAVDTRDPDAPFGPGGTVGVVIEDINQVKIDIEDLEEVYGDTVSAAASAAAAAASANAAAIAETNAETAQTNAETARNAAQSARDLAEDARDTAIAEASDAEASATIASNKATEASTSATQASTAKDDAEGAAAAALISQQATAQASKSTYPDNFTDPNNWDDYANWGGSATFNGTNALTFLGGSVIATWSMPLVAGERYRITARYRVLNQGGGTNYFGISNDATGLDWIVAARPSPAVGVWETITGEIDANQILANWPTATRIKPVGLVGYNGVSDGEISSVKLENITSEKNAFNSAQAAATSEANAAASVTDAGEFAAAANLSATNAATSAGQASTSETNAATSATNALGSANTASSSATVAATARDAAQAASKSTYPDNFTDTNNWTNYGHWGGSSTFNGTNALTFGGGSIISTYWIPFIPNQRYRITVRHRVLNQGGGSNYFGIYNDSISEVSQWFAVVPSVAVGQWQTTVGEYNSNDVFASYPLTTRVKLAAIIGHANISDGEISSFKFENITSETNSANSASASATSASTANAAKTAAETAATAADTSRVNAQTAAGEADASRIAAANSATSASGSANSALISQQAASAAKNQAWAVQGNMDFAGGFEGWYHNGAQLVDTTEIISSADYSIGNGFSWPTVLTKSTYMNIRNIKRITPVPGRKYKLSARLGAYVNGSSGVTSTIFLGLYAYDVNGTYIGSQWPLLSGVSITDGQTTAPSTIIDGQTILDSYSNTAYFQIVAHLNYNSNSITSYLDYFTIEDVTESQSAAGSATAAANSASAANTSATDAGVSASAANTSKVNAETAAGNALTSANNASNSSAAASNSAAAALASQTIAASVSTMAINRNPLFANWPTSNSFPDYWTLNTGSAYREVGEHGIGNGLKLDGGAAADAYFSYETGSATTASLVPDAYYIIEADVRLNSGTLVGSGVLFRPWNSTASSYVDIHLNFSLESFDGENRVGDGVVGKIYRFRKIVRAPSTINSTINAQFFHLFGMSHWTAFGSVASANSLTWYRCAVRQASDAEVQGYRSSAEVNILAGAVADIAGRQSAFWQTEAGVGGSAADAFITVRADLSDPVAAPITPYKLVNVSWQGRAVKRNSGLHGDWDRGFVSNEAYTNTAYCQAVCPNTITYTMFGLTDDGPSQVPYYINIDYALYFNAGGGLIYESGTNPAGSFTYGSTDFFSVEYNQNSGGTIIYKKNGKQVIRTVTGVGTGRTFRFMCSLYSYDPGTNSYSELRNVVFGATPPSATSSVSIGAQEFHVLNQDDGTWKKALSVTGGNVQVFGKLQAGSVEASMLNVTSLSAITANIGLLRTASTGARTEIENNLIRVFDASGNEVVRLGTWDD